MTLCRPRERPLGGSEISDSKAKQGHTEIGRKAGKGPKKSNPAKKAFKSMITVATWLPLGYIYT